MDELERNLKRLLPDELLDPLAANEKRARLRQWLEYVIELLPEAQYMGFTIPKKLVKQELLKGLYQLPSDQLLAIWTKGKVLNVFE